MEYARRKWGRDALALAAGAAFLLAACSSDPVDLGNGNGNDVNDHADPAGVVITLGGQPVAGYMDGDEELPVLGLEAHTTLEFLGVTFVDAQENPIELDEDFTINLVIGDETHMGWTLETDHTLDVHFVIHVEGREPGMTTVRLQLVHDDHVDWETPDITVFVEEPENGENGENG